MKLHYFNVTDHEHGVVTNIWFETREKMAAAYKEWKVKEKTEMDANGKPLWEVHDCHSVDNIDCTKKGIVRLLNAFTN